MKLINGAPWFNFINNGFVYVCLAEDGTFWVRSVAGKWTQIKNSTPMSLDAIQKDLDEFLLNGVPATENDVKVDNSSQIVIDPKPIVSGKAEEIKQ